jgi:hypothetical protein
MLDSDPAIVSGEREAAREKRRETQIFSCEVWTLAYRGVIEGPTARPISHLRPALQNSEEPGDSSRLGRWIGWAKTICGGQLGKFCDRELKTAQRVITKLPAVSLAAWADIEQTLEIREEVSILSAHKSQVGGRYDRPLSLLGMRSPLARALIPYS